MAPLMCRFVDGVAAITAAHDGGRMASAPFGARECEPLQSQAPALRYIMLRSAVARGPAESCRRARALGAQQAWRISKIKSSNR
jgi:hypothetical protein